MIKRYHPDTVRAPEKVRQYTIRCVEIIDAYNEALTYAEASKKEAKETEGLLFPNELTRKRNLFALIFGYIEMPFLYAFGVLFLLEYVFGIPWLSKGLTFITSNVVSLPDDNLFKKVLSAVFAIVGGILFSFLLYIPLVVPFTIVWSNIVNTKLERYACKAGFFIMVAIYIYIAYFTSLFSNTPFSYQQEGYYSLLADVLRLTFCFTAPSYLFGQWIKDLFRYKRIKDKIKFGE